MKKSIVVLIMVVVLIGGLVFIRGPAQRTIGTLRQIEQSLDMVERLQGILEVNTAELNRISVEWQKAQKEIEVLNSRIGDHVVHIQSLESKIDNLPTYEIPPPSTIRPKDYEECITELNRSRLRADTLVMVIDTKRDKITLLRAVNTSQGLIIASQAEIIEKQSSYIENFEALLKEYNRRANRRILIGTAVGFIVALLI